jgi:predicted nuclease of predicted toxin-antitoxin system
LTVAKLYSNENFPLQVVRQLRLLGHDVLTSLEAGQANRRIPDDEVLRFAAMQERVLLMQNRRDFLKLHNSGRVNHSGIVLCTADPDFAGQAMRIDAALPSFQKDLPNGIIRVNRPAK